MSSNSSQATSFLFFSTKVITFEPGNIFVLIWYSEWPLVVVILPKVVGAYRIVPRYPEKFIYFVVFSQYMNFNSGKCLYESKITKGCTIINNVCTFYKSILRLTFWLKKYVGTALPLSFLVFVPSRNSKVRLQLFETLLIRIITLPANFFSVSPE